MLTVLLTAFRATDNQKKAQAREAAKKLDATLAARAAAVQSLACMVEEPREVWQAAVDLVKRYIPAANAYVANIVEDEEPDHAPGDEEAAEGGEADGTGSDDEEGGASGDGDGGAAPLPLANGTLLAVLTVAGGDGKGGGAAEEGEGEGAERAAEGEGAGEEDGDGGAAAQPRPDYSDRLLSYVAASAGQEFMTKVELRRWPAREGGQGGEEGDGMASQRDGAAAAAAVPVTFRVLDEYLPLLEVRGLMTGMIQEWVWCRTLSELPASSPHHLSRSPSLSSTHQIGALTSTDPLRQPRAPRQVPQPRRPPQNRRLRGRRRARRPPAFCNRPAAAPLDQPAGWRLVPLYPRGRHAAPGRQRAALPV